MKLLQVVPTLLFEGGGILLELVQCEKLGDRGGLSLCGLCAFVGHNDLFRSSLSPSDARETGRVYIQVGIQVTN